MWEENLHTSDISILSYFQKQKKIIRLLGTAAQKLHLRIRPGFFKEKARVTAKSSVKWLVIIPARERRMKTTGCASMDRTRGDHSLPRGHRPSNRQQKPGSVCFPFIPNSVLRGPPEARPHWSPARAAATHGRPGRPSPRQPAHRPRSQLGGAGAAPAARRPLAGCHVTLRGNQELRGAAGGRGRGRGPGRGWGVRGG